jgi:HSP20 family protein|tara:strand:+ start:628 stop:1050 length:423 start_codon:yes stop_codon:yes gene_type:complete
MRKNRKNPNDVFGIEDLLDSWMDMMNLAYNTDVETSPIRKPSMARPKHEGTMSYEEREKDIVFTIDMPGVAKKDIEVEVLEHSISVKAENGGKRKYNYSRRFKPTVDSKSAKATFTNGVLDITINKVIEEKPKGTVVKIN